MLIRCQHFGAFKKRCQYFWHLKAIRLVLVTPMIRYVPVCFLSFQEKGNKIRDFILLFDPIDHVSMVSLMSGILKIFK